MSTLFSTEMFNRPTKKSYKKTNFLKLTDGRYLIRVLKQELKSYPTHFIKAGNFATLCLGNDCPICDHNRELMFKYAKEFYKQPDFMRISYRTPINILDRTTYKVCPNCNMEHKKVGKEFPARCDCGTLLTSVEATVSNKVKLLNASDTLAKHLTSLEIETTDEEDNPIGIVNYDIVLVVDTSNKNDPVTPVAKTANNDVIEVDKENFNEGKGFFELNVNEIKDVLHGVSLRDILSSRTPVKEENEVSEVVEEVSKEKIAKVQSLVSKLFDQDDEEDI
jgi:hypothetical protein